MYKDANEAYFMDNDTYEQFTLSLEDIGQKAQFLKDGTDVDTLYFNDKPVSISLPVKMNFKVVSAPPAVKGNSVSTHFNSCNKTTSGLEFFNHSRSLGRRAFTEFTLKLAILI